MIWRRKRRREEMMTNRRSWTENCMPSGFNLRFDSGNREKSRQGKRSELLVFCTYHQGRLFHRLVTSSSISPARAPKFVPSSSACVIADPVLTYSPRRYPSPLCRVCQGYHKTRSPVKCKSRPSLASTCLYRHDYCLNGLILVFNVQHDYDGTWSGTCSWPGLERTNYCHKEAFACSYKSKMRSPIMPERFCRLHK